jgi:hypothetical protein
VVDSDESPPARRGCGAIAILVAAVLVATIAVVPWARDASIRSHNESEAVRSLRRIYTAQQILSGERRDKDGRRVYGTLEEIRATGLFHPEDYMDRREGYVVETRPSTTDPSSFWAMAAPEIPGVTGNRAFYFASGMEQFVVLSVGPDSPRGSDPAFPRPNPATCAPPANALPSQPPIRLTTHAD